jgi:hypothetical protein
MSGPQTAEERLEGTLALLQSAFEEAEQDPSWRGVVMDESWLWWPLDAPAPEGGDYEAPYLDLRFRGDGRVSASMCMEDPRSWVRLPESLADRARALLAKSHLP